MNMKSGLLVGTLAIAIGLPFGPTAAAQDEPIGWISKWDGGAPTFAGDGWDFKIFGRAQFDYNFARSDETDDFDISNTQIRRLRLGAKGSFGDSLSYKLQVNFDEGGDITAEDVYVQWEPAALGGWAIQLGHFKTQNSFDEINSSKFTTFLERAAFTDAFELDRRLGVALRKFGDNYSLETGVFLTNLDNVSGNEEGWAASGRATYSPILEEDLKLHLGASFRYRNQGDDENLLEFRQRPFTENTDRIISTGNIAGSDTFVQGEVIAQYKQFWAAGEYAVTFANTDLGLLGAGDATFDGWYAETGFYIGGKRIYKKGKFDRPTIDRPITKGGYGAFSGAIRYDTLDLNSSGIEGGKQDTIAVAADWWPTRYTRLGINYFHSDNSLGNPLAGVSGVDGSVLAVLAQGVTDETVNGINVRLHFDF